VSSRSPSRGRGGCHRGSPSRGAAGGVIEVLVEEVTRRISGRLFLVLDQFEEFFIRLTAAQRQSFIDLLARLSGGMGKASRAHVVLSLREDFLAEMSLFEEQIPTVLRNSLRLVALTGAGQGGHRGAGSAV